MEKEKGSNKQTTAIPVQLCGFALGISGVTGVVTAVIGAICLGNDGVVCKTMTQTYFTIGIQACGCSIAIIYAGVYIAGKLCACRALDDWNDPKSVSAMSTLPLCIAFLLR